MSPELTSLTWIAALMAIMWVPYVLNTVMVRGLVDAVGYPERIPSLWLHGHSA
jgi:hypothetical protein